MTNPEASIPAHWRYHVFEEPKTIHAPWSLTFGVSGHVIKVSGIAPTDCIERAIEAEKDFDRLEEER